MYKLPYGSIANDESYKKFKYNTFLKNEFNAIEYYRLHSYSNQLLSYNTMNDNELKMNNDESNLNYKINHKSSLNYDYNTYKEYLLICNIFIHSNKKYSKFENTAIMLNPEVNLDRMVVIQLSILCQIVSGCLAGIGAAVTYGLPLNATGNELIFTRIFIALCFYVPVYILQIYSLLFAYQARFSPLAARSLGNMISDTLSILLYTVYKLENFDKEMIASIIISISFGLTSISYAIILQLYASKLELSDEQMYLLSDILDSLEIINDNQDGSLEFISNKNYKEFSKFDVHISEHLQSKLVIIGVFISSSLLCNLIGILSHKNLFTSFIFQLAAAFLKPLYQILPSSLNLSKHVPSIQLSIRSFVAFIFALPEFCDHLQAINIAKAGGNVIVSNAVGNLPAELLTAFVAYQWLGECIDIPIRLTILSATVMFITQIYLHYC